jgi:hypothetical protein
MSIAAMNPPRERYGIHEISTGAFDLEQLPRSIDGAQDRALNSHPLIHSVAITRKFLLLDPANKIVSGNLPIR